LILWLNAEGEIPSLAAPRVKLRSRATTANAARTLKFSVGN
jgi:hypothetical protein